MGEELFKSVLQVQNGNKDELMFIIEKFSPLIQKYKRKLNYDESETDLIIALIEIVLSIKLNNFMSYSEGKLIKFINNSIANKSIDLFRKFIIRKKQEVELDFDVIDNTNIEDDLNNRILIMELLANLSDKQKFIIIEKYFKCRSDMDIAKNLNISRQAINKSKNEALKKLKYYILD
ncbi:sigma-70 family RNA polymerase sigma factor [Clostridium saccharoperbutylacetonicum]|jgi:RNA polymerase sigma factor (sigma-70 family)|nr:hypothetical protein [Haloplasmataceae bacterium]